MKKHLATLCAAAILLMLPACQTQPPSRMTPPPTVESVDLERYAGEWFELGRLPVFYQRDDERAVARYSPRPDGKVDVFNTAIALHGSQRSVIGIAEPIPQSGNSKLRVKIEKWPATWIPVSAQGNYWILDLAPDYSYALVGTPDRRFLWLLSRSPEPNTAVITAMIKRASALGYDTSRLIFPPATR